MGKIKFICKDLNDRIKSTFSSSLWPTYYQFHLNLAVGCVSFYATPLSSFYATPLSSKEISCRLRAVWQIKRLPQDVGGFAISLIPFCLSILLYLMKLSHVSVNSGSLIPPTPFFGGILLSFLFPFLRSLPYTSLLPPLVTSFSVPCSEGLLSFPVACNPSPVNAGIFLLTTHSTIQLKIRASLQQSWIWFPDSTFEYCLPVKRYPQRWLFTYRQLISEKLFVLSLAQELVKGGWKAMY